MDRDHTSRVDVILIGLDSFVERIRDRQLSPIPIEAAGDDDPLSLDERFRSKRLVPPHERERSGFVLDRDGQQMALRSHVPAVDTRYRSLRRCFLSDLEIANQFGGREVY